MYSFENNSNLILTNIFNKNTVFKTKLVRALFTFFSSVQSPSRVSLQPPWTAARQAFLSINSRSLLKLMSIESAMPFNHLILCHPLLLRPSNFPSIRVFSEESVCIRWPKYWSFSFSISPSNENSGLISFTIDWLHLLVVHGTLKSLLQHHSSKASVHQCSAFFMDKLSISTYIRYPYMLLLLSHFSRV